MITSACARLFQAEPPLALYDYRDALGLDRQLPIAFSPSLPGWALALDDLHDRHVLALGGRTVEVFDERLLGSYGGPSRGALAGYLWFRVQDLACSRATIHLMGQLYSALASGRDRVPEPGESPRSFARRISRDLVALRRGNDAATVCTELLDSPDRMGPVRALSQLDFVVDFPPGGGRLMLKDRWTEWLRDHAEAVRRLARDQQGWLSTSAQVSGLGANIRLQRQLWILTMIAIAVAIMVGVLQLTSGPSAQDGNAAPTPALYAR